MGFCCTLGDQEGGETGGTEQPARHTAKTRWTLGSVRRLQRLRVNLLALGVGECSDREGETFVGNHKQLSTAEFSTKCFCVALAHKMRVM